MSTIKYSLPSNRWSWRKGEKGEKTPNLNVTTTKFYSWHKAHSSNSPPEIWREKECACVCVCYIGVVFTWNNSIFSQLMQYHHILLLVCSNQHLHGLWMIQPYYNLPATNVLKGQHCNSVFLIFCRPPQLSLLPLKRPPLTKILH